MASFTLDPQSLRHLRERLLQTGPAEAPSMLFDAGHASGGLLAGRWLARLDEAAGLKDSGKLDARWFGPLLSDVTASLGWGSLSVKGLGERGLLLESSDWAEADGSVAPHPACHFTSGAISAFLTGQAGSTMTVMEVECRATGAESCRFVAGSGEMVSLVWDLMKAGRDWREAFPPLTTD